MASSSSSSCCFPLAVKIDDFGPVRSSAEFCKQGFLRRRVNLKEDWSFIGGSKVILKPQLVRSVLRPKSSAVHASWFSSSELARNVFTLGTAAVLPFYTLMIGAPKSEITKKCMASGISYVLLGLVYAYLLCLSWTPETIRLLLVSKYYLPELSSIGKMFSREMTLASAWIHLLVIDLFAARFFMTDWRMKLRLAIQFLSACSVALLVFSLILSPNNLQKLP